MYVQHYPLPVAIATLIELYSCTIVLCIRATETCLMTRLFLCLKLCNSLACETKLQHVHALGLDPYPTHVPLFHFRFTSMLQKWPLCLVKQLICRSHHIPIEIYWQCIQVENFVHIPPWMTFVMCSICCSTEWTELSSHQQCWDCTHLNTTWLLSRMTLQRLFQMPNSSKEMLPKRVSLVRETFINQNPLYLRTSYSRNEYIRLVRIIMFSSEDN